MAKCEEGYLCEVCGQDVAEITESDLYLRYVIGLRRSRGAAHHAASGTSAATRRWRSSSSMTISRRSRSKAPSTSGCSIRPTSASRRRSSPAASAASRSSPRLDLPILDYPLPEVRAEMEKQSKSH